MFATPYLGFDLALHATWAMLALEDYSLPADLATLGRTETRKYTPTFTTVTVFKHVVT